MCFFQRCHLLGANGATSSCTCTCVCVTVCVCSGWYWLDERQHVPRELSITTGAAESSQPAPSYQAVECVERQYPNTQKHDCVGAFLWCPHSAGRRKARWASSPYLAARAVYSKATVVAPRDERLMPFACASHRADPIRLARTAQQGHTHIQRRDG